VAVKVHMHYYMCETEDSKNKAVFLLNMVAIFWILFSVTLHSLGASNTVLFLIYLLMLVMHTNTLILFSKYKKKKMLASP